mmetsp:Transcript_24774/g.28632  ORF Transcript_24774/g.28632 Transcript_24774/m.28632 type:complete len:146 (-) Transcript_24774:130-567(-)
MNESPISNSRTLTKPVTAVLRNRRAKPVLHINQLNTPSIMIRALLLTLLLAVSTLGFAPSPAFRVAAPSNTELGVSVKIECGEGEPIESALRRFKREVNKSGHLMELRHRRHFENSQEKKKRKIKEGRMRKRLERMNKRRMNNRT